MKYLMVCFGNICRSPMAEGILRHKLAKSNSQSEVDSCGFEPYHIGDEPDGRAQEIMLKQGIDISSIRARLLHPDDFEKFDHIFVMDQSIMRNVISAARKEDDLRKVQLIMNIPYPGENRIVADPYYGKDDSFEKVFQQLDEATDAIIRKYERS